LLYAYLSQAVQTHFDCLKILKEGPRGQVQLLRHRESGQRFVFRRFLGDGKVYRRLLQVDCPYLPRIYEVAEWDNQVLVLEEYIPGDSLTFLLEGGPLPRRTVKKIGRQLCAALSVLHETGSVHRDIKPDNIILRGDTAVLIDFDAARIYDPGQQQDTRVLGTIGFAAPEQFGFVQSDHRADIYSMGVLLNVMLTGKHPSMEQVGGNLGRIIARCTAMNPKNRYQSVQQLMDLL